MLTVVTGPPCSGKSSYVAGHRRPGDIVVDFDVLAAALGSEVRHDHERYLSSVTAAAWAAAVARILAALPAGRSAWIIDSRPPPHRRRTYARAHAAVVAMPAGQDELDRRAADRARTEPR